jgi:alpha-maltose-1-phosphate synthase
MSEPSAFVIATPGRSVCDDNARVLHRLGRLRFIALGTRRGTAGIPREFTRLNPKIGLVTTVTARLLSEFKGESLRFRLNPWFDRWVKKQLTPGDHIISSFGYANDCFKWARRNGGKAILAAGNSHPENFWTIMTEEHRRWNCSDPPIDPSHYERSKAMLLETDYVFAPSSFVANSFLTRGFKPSQVLKEIYPVNFAHFKPAMVPREKNRPLTVISTGTLSLRKGTPYLLEAFRLVLRKHPSARLRLTRRIQDSAAPVVEKYRDLPIDWAPGLPHPQLAERLRGSDIFVLPSLEEGLVRTALEAMACGLPVVLTPNTGTADYVTPGVNGEVVPIRDPQAIADAILKWADLILGGKELAKPVFDINRVSFETYEKEYLSELRSVGLV